MTHYSQVGPAVFAEIKGGHKIVEPRLNDVAHQRVRLGDLVVITNRVTHEEIVTKVVGVLRYATFDELFAALSPSYFGVTDVAAVKEQVNSWYSPSAQRAHGVIGIKLHLLRAA
ncbi:MAG TPA: ASCH domain-containing protein [Magnetospirillaceae bacterium]|nr:ASCH domain-containing protein [Magnetospirillaceae bacterium]